VPLEPDVVPEPVPPIAASYAMANAGFDRIVHGRLYGNWEWCWRRLRSLRQWLRWLRDCFQPRFGNRESLTSNRTMVAFHGGGRRADGSVTCIAAITDATLDLGLPAGVRCRSMARVGVGLWHWALWGRLGLLAARLRV
jgi:hypothetical protein